MGVMARRPLGAVALAALALLAACQRSPREPGDDQRSAAGEVLSGSVSDAMIPYDTLTSEPPLAAPRAGRAGRGSEAGQGDAAAGAAPAPTEPPQDQPAPTSSLNPPAAPPPGA